MHILIAPDSFKDALGATDAANAIAEGVRQAAPDADWTLCPLGDGGEGTLEALLVASNAEARSLEVHDALNRPRTAQWGWIADRRTAIVELAEASGLQHLTNEERDALHTTTRGVGELIHAALEEGAEHLILTLGGSATNDGGTGMMSALGVRFLDKSDRVLAPGGAALADLARIDCSGIDSRVAGLTVEAAVDVNNPLCGDQGASAIFGPQKGATKAQVNQLDQALARLAEVTANATGQDHRDSAGAGAAGGMGFAALAFLSATLRPGIELVMEQVGFDQALERADLVITGEGRLDGQSLSGKTPIGVSRAAHRQGVPCVVLAGKLDSGWEKALDEGVTAAFALADGPMALEEALERAPELLSARSASIVRLFRHGR
ncbi:glycerate kinase [Kushneria indalinina]|uniref:Glycerate kinase n=1 Tax=Kushneria indalinina DSM 14324 TaxID=1122140 RepID=A0A3D9DVD9_9GAMM|nr:glycerate kinase [Kushneria indalinina]REC94641.1 glycerate kinase [Kushneria indalinina DSM 14324]